MPSFDELAQESANRIISLVDWYRSASAWMKHNGSENSANVCEKGSVAKNFYLHQILRRRLVLHRY